MSDLSVQFDAASPIPAYRQIVNGIRVHLQSGALKSGDSLPSVRSLAAQLGVHHNTVAEAWRELAEEGWIDLNHGRRAVVLGRKGRPALAPEEAGDLRQRLRHLISEMRLKGFSPSSLQREFDAALQQTLSASSSKGR